MGENQPRTGEQFARNSDPARKPGYAGNRTFNSFPQEFVPRHWHSANETITLIRGTFIMEHNDSGNKMELDAGSFAYIPAKMIHQAWTKPDEDALYFITVDGKWDINWVDEPEKATK